MISQYVGFERVDLGGGFVVWRGKLPAQLVPPQLVFDKLWDLHPASFPEAKLYGKPVKFPRWQQAFGRDYRFSGKTSTAQPVPELVQPYLEWVRDAIDVRLNGALLNWYDGSLGHYIGAHRDSLIDIVKGSPIAMVSLGQERTYRFGQWRGQAKVDVPATSGDVVVIPYDTNLAWTHAVPKSRHHQGRRISITLRAFVPHPDRPASSQAVL